MSASIFEAKALLRSVRALIKAEVADSWKGSQPPEDWPHYERELEKKRANFEAALRRVAPDIKIKWKESK